MAFNAYEKFKKIIVDTLDELSIVEERKFNNIKDFKNILEVLSKTTGGFTLKDIEKVAPYGIRDIEIKERDYEFGITFIDSQVSFYDNKLDFCYLNQIFVTKKKSNEPIINITILSYVPYTLFRNILKSVVALDLGGCYTSYYETYIDNLKKEVQKEEYRRNYHYEGGDFNDNSLIDSLNATSKTLSFIYFNGYIEKVLINKIEQIDTKIFIDFILNEIEEKVKEIYRKIDLEINNKKRVKSPCNNN